ncbi:armadillo repeat-containing protein 8-like [Centruroides sculpturatus]|uniref:armadillo repeat-containing protein 8-like n=1 Tax=Centruroides sculpturatus TaxID=218467 RepID=UPI000C6E81EB|nr:armadillo repeat-containing protein 8-like [Centruroides sculpturatus]
MVPIIQPYMEVENNRLYLDPLYSSDPETCLNAVIQLKNSVIGSNRQKGLVIQLGVLPRLLNILGDESSTTELMVETVVTIGSLVKGTDDHVKSLIDAGIIPVLLRGLGQNHAPYVEACLRCLRTIFTCSLAPVDVLYSDDTIIPHLIGMAANTGVSNRECVTTILKNACTTSEHQNFLCNNGAVDALAALLSSSIYRFVSNNYIDISDYIQFIIISILISDIFSMTYLCRAEAISPNDSRIVFKTLPTLVRMCKKDQSPEERVEGAETLAYLTEVDTELQRVASISDHLIPTLAELLKYQPPSAGIVGTGAVSATTMKKLEQEMRLEQEMKQAAFKAFASLSANDEEIRKKIIETDFLMEHVVTVLSDPNPRLRLAAVRCLHSLSRSVQQLRTTFQDHAVWRPLMKLLHNAPDDILTVASSTLCNLLLEFSPSKEPILECGVVELLCSLTKQEDPALRLNGVWALMNMAFQADQKIKSQILTTLGTDQIFHLLTDPDVNVLMKTLGLLRNLLSTKPHIDHIMGLHGNQIMQAIILILEGDHTTEVKEQALCILANIADGDSAKDFIMSNEDVLKKLTTYMMHSNVKLQISATFCICNLSWNEEEGALERQAKLRDLGVQKLLQQLLTTTDTTLFDKVKTALQQFT